MNPVPIKIYFPYKNISGSKDILSMKHHKSDFIQAYF